MFTHIIRAYRRKPQIRQRWGLPIIVAYVIVALLNLFVHTPWVKLAGIVTSVLLVVHLILCICADDLEI